MPFTPFHLGPALLIGLLAYRYLDFPTFLIANVIVDIRAALVYLNIVEGSLHGILHTFLGGTLLAFALIGAITPVREYLRRIMDSYGLFQEHDDGTVVAAGFLGIYLHIILDSVLYTDIEPLYPLVENPLLEALTGVEVYAFCALCGMIGLAVLPWKIDSLSDKDSLQQ